MVLNTNSQNICCNPNLLDNWYFGNPVNQRGQTNYPGRVYAYTIDRWATSSGNGGLVVNDGYLTVTTRTVGAAVDQIQEFPYPPGTVLTLSALMRCTTANAGLQCRFGNDGTTATDYSNTVTLTGTGDWELVTLPLTIPSGIGAVLQSPRFRGTAAGTTYDIKAIKLELGSQQTLAHQENGKWVLNEIPDYGEQLRRCQRYLFKIRYGQVPATSIGSKSIEFMVPCPVTMRDNPTIINNNLSVTTVINNTKQEGFTFSVSPLKYDNLIYIIAQKENHGLTTASLHGGETDYTYLSADLYDY